jgi:hypothetical protein
MTDLERAQQVKAAMPVGGLFAGQNWRVGTRPLALGGAMVRDLEMLGRVLLQFYRASNLLYRRSVEGRMPGWIADLVDQGKPAELVAWQRHVGFKSDVPRVIRPDVLLTETGIAISELDSVPGGIGLTHWLNSTYGGLGEPVLGGVDGMLRGFESIFAGTGRVRLVVSEESASYRPEMEWLAGLLGSRFEVVRQDFDGVEEGDSVYRFFELFDLANVPQAGKWFGAAAEKRIRLTPPPKPLFEEKLWMGLLWNRNLRSYWRTELGEGFLDRLLKATPYTWVMDPSPLPPHAAYPGLELTDWQQLKGLSQRERDLILKVSGFSPTAWGARGVHLGSDLSSEEWSVAVDGALKAWGTNPHLLQRYHKPRGVETAWLDGGTVQPMTGRVRLCPYYFVAGDGDAARPKLGGVMATICPADKKIIHGMTDAVIVPCVE